ncbi:MAG: mechanosensitive ion channel [Xanthomonadales bacterium]|nr:mechanosensitive ion channel [Gammaproteobacteria bacterium]MBT8057156.1 mechanosensitive ion channel [Gammaproteobacteria bacterium]NNL04009.1 mechanosensitive ion channel [Xanthomonadales bacterium]
MSDFEKYWNLTLVTLSNGATITVAQVVLTIAVVVLSLMAIWWLQRLLGRQLAKSNVDPNVAQTIQRVVFYSLLVLVFITALGLLRIPVTALAFISGAVAIGVGFGAQNIINNLISGWILMSERPVRIGDFVEIDQHRGVVESIGNRSTRIRRIDGVHLLVPNSQMLERVVVNWTLVDRDFRTSVRVGVAYGSPVRKVEELLLKAAAGQKDVLENPPSIAVFEDYGDSALVFDLFFWSRALGERELRLVRSDIRFRINELFNDHGIVIAFPQRDVHLYTHEPAGREKNAS